MSDWKTYKLGDLVKIKGGKRLPKGKMLTNQPNKHPYIRVTDMGTRFVPIDKLMYVPDDIFPQIKNYITNTSDIILSIVGTIGQVAIIDVKLNNASLTENCVKLKIIDEKLNSIYLYYFLTSIRGQEELKRGTVGSTQPKLPLYNIEKIEIAAPDLPTQQQIAQILSSLDDKIELNLQMNQTLEAMAQAIFKEWFVDFNFPGFDGELVDLPDGKAGRLPKGWRMGKLGEEFDLIMGQSPPGLSYNEIGEGMVFYQGRTDFGFRFPTNRLYTTEPKRIANPLDTLVSVRAPVGDINMATEMCCVGRGLSAVLHKTKAYSFTYYMMKNIEPIFRGFEGEGTVFGSINKANFENIEIIVPDINILKEFELIVNPIDNKILENANQIQALSQTRDTLLPKLMSGQLEVKNEQK